MTVMNIEYLFGYTTGAYKKLKDDLRFYRLYGWIQFLLVNKTNDQHALEIPCATNWKCARSVLLHMAYVEFSFSRIVTSTNKSWLYKLVDVHLVDVHAVYCTLHMLEFSFYRVVTSTNKSFLYKLVNVHIFVYILFIWKKKILQSRIQQWNALIQFIIILCCNYYANILFIVKSSSMSTSIIYTAWIIVVFFIIYLQKKKTL